MSLPFKLCSASHLHNLHKVRKGSEQSFPWTTCSVYHGLKICPDAFPSAGVRDKLVLVLSQRIELLGQ